MSEENDSTIWWLLAVVFVVGALMFLMLTHLPKLPTPQEYEDSRWSEVEYKGHSYLIRGGGDTSTRTHNPDCKCKEVK